MGWPVLLAHTTVEVEVLLDRKVQLWDTVSPMLEESDPEDWTRDSNNKHIIPLPILSGI